MFVLNQLVHKNSSGEEEDDFGFNLMEGPSALLEYDNHINGSV